MNISPTCEKVSQLCGHTWESDLAKDLPIIDDGLDLRLRFPPFFRLGRRAFMRKTGKFKLLLGEVKISGRHLGEV
jgi:hypothetical protein